jgi:two-component system, OmpR family, KDP operon response regulator KdpE
MKAKPDKVYTVLVVDDDPDILLQHQVQLEGAGYKVITADGKHSAQAVLQGTRPDAVLLDLMMEEADGGFLLARQIKQQDASIPVVLVSAVAGRTGLDFSTADAQERSWAKVDAILAKPVRMEQLQRELNRLLADAR